MRVLWDLFVAFFRAGNFNFGGGPAMIPMIRFEVVEKYKWISNEQFADMLAIANSLPAPIAPKLAGIIGYKVKGWRGVFAANLGAIMPMALIVAFLGTVMVKYAETEAVQAMFKGVRPVVAVLLAHTAFTMSRNAFDNKLPLTWVIGIAALLIMLFLPIHPAFLVIAAMILGYFLMQGK